MCKRTKLSLTTFVLAVMCLQLHYCAYKISHSASPVLDHKIVTQVICFCEHMTVYGDGGDDPSWYQRVGHVGIEVKTVDGGK